MTEDPPPRRLLTAEDVARRIASECALSNNAEPIDTIAVTRFRVSR